MEYLQYGKACTITSSISNFGFKPYYKWNTFNTLAGLRSIRNTTLEF